MDLSKLLARAYVLAGSFVTYVTAIAAGLMLSADRIAEAAPEGHEDVTQALLVVVAVLGEIVAIVRSVVPAPGSARGLVLPDGVQLTVKSDHPGGADVEVKGKAA